MATKMASEAVSCGGFLLCVSALRKILVDQPGSLVEHLANLLGAGLGADRSRYAPLKMLHKNSQKSPPTLRPSQKPRCLNTPSGKSRIKAVGNATRVRLGNQL